MNIYTQLACFEFIGISQEHEAEAGEEEEGVYKVYNPSNGQICQKKKKKKKKKKGHRKQNKTRKDNGIGGLTPNSSSNPHRGGGEDVLWNNMVLRSIEFLKLPSFSLSYFEIFFFLKMEIGDWRY